MPYNNKPRIQRITDEELINYVTMDDLEQARSNDIHFVAEHTSLDIAQQLILKCGGLNLYIPNATSIRGAMRNYIRQHFSGNNHRELALRLGISEGSVYKMLGE